jgi:hypothetical protein
MVLSNRVVAYLPGVIELPTTCLPRKNHFQGR